MSYNSGTEAERLVLKALARVSNDWSGLTRIHITYDATPRKDSQKHRIYIQFFSLDRILKKGPNPYFLETTLPGSKLIAESVSTVLQASKYLKSKTACPVDITIRGIEYQKLRKEARTHTNKVRKSLTSHMEKKTLPADGQEQRLLREIETLYETARNASGLGADFMPLEIYFRNEIDLDHVKPLYLHTSSQDLMERSLTDNLQALTKSAHREKTKADSLIKVS